MPSSTVEAAEYLVEHPHDTDTKAMTLFMKMYAAVQVEAEVCTSTFVYRHLLTCCTGVESMHGKAPIRQCHR